MPKMELPASIRAFVDTQTTVDVERIRDAAGPVVFPYSEYWRRAIAGMLLSGRVKPKNDAAPNRTDLNRICKEANFNPHLFERFSGFLVHSQIVEAIPGRTSRVARTRTTSCNVVGKRVSL